MKFITLPIYRLPTLLSATKEGFKALPYEGGVVTMFFLYIGTAPVTQPGNARTHNRGPKYRTFSCIYDILIVLPTPSLHIEMVTYCTASYTNNRTCQIAYK